MRAAIATLDDREAHAPTVKAACEALGAQLKNDVEMLVPSHASLLAALCTRLNLVLENCDEKLAKRVIGLSMACFEHVKLMASYARAACLEPMGLVLTQHSPWGALADLACLRRARATGAPRARSGCSCCSLYSGSSTLASSNLATLPATCSRRST